MTLRRAVLAGGVPLLAVVALLIVTAMSDEPELRRITLTLSIVGIVLVLGCLGGAWLFDQLKVAQADVVQLREELAEARVEMDARQARSEWNAMREDPARRHLYRR